MSIRGARLSQRVGQPTPLHPSVRSACQTGAAWNHLRRLSEGSDTLESIGTHDVNTRSQSDSVEAVGQCPPADRGAFHPSAQTTDLG